MATASQIRAEDVNEGPAASGTYARTQQMVEDTTVLAQQLLVEDERKLYTNTRALQGGGRKEPKKTKEPPVGGFPSIENKN